MRAVCRYALPFFTHATESDAVAPLLFICYRASAHLVAQVGSAVLYNLIAGNERVDNVLYAVARAELHEDRSRLALELSR